MYYYYVGGIIEDISKKLSIQDYMDCIDWGEKNVRLFKNLKDAEAVARYGLEENSKEQYPVFKVKYDGEGVPSVFKGEDIRIQGIAAPIKDLSFVSASLKHVNEDFHVVSIEKASHKQSTPEDTVKQLKSKGLTSYTKPAIAIAATAGVWYFGGVDYLAGKISYLITNVIPLMTSTILIGGASFIAVEAVDRGRQWAANRKKSKTIGDAQIPTQTQIEELNKVQQALEKDKLTSDSKNESPSAKILDFSKKGKAPRKKDVSKEQEVQTLRPAQSEEISTSPEDNGKQKKTGRRKKTPTNKI